MPLPLRFSAESGEMPQKYQAGWAIWKIRQFRSFRWPIPG